MAINVDWDNEEKTIVRFLYSGQWNMSELSAAVQESNKLMDRVNHSVGCIIDIRDSNLIPSGVLSMGRSVVVRKHPNQGNSIVVGANTFIVAMFDVFRKVYHTKFVEAEYKFVRTLDEARSLLKSEQLTV
jgi:hypothetical protein